MFDLSKFLPVVKAAAKGVRAAGAPMFEVADVVIDFAKAIRPILNEPDQAKLDAALPDLLNAMNRDVDQALADLRG